MQHTLETITSRTIEGTPITRNEVLTLARTADFDALLAGADNIRKTAAGNRFILCSVMNIRSGNCSEDCRYCAQSAHYETGAPVHPLSDEDEILDRAKRLEDAGVHRFSLVTSGRALKGRDLDRTCRTFSRLSAATNLHLCGSLGIIDEKSAIMLREAGCSTIHHNLETSRRFFPSVCTTHTFEDRVRTIKIVRSAGMNVCSGGIIGLGETMEDRIDMALDLRDLGIRSVPVNVLVPIPGTPLENAERLEPGEILRTMAIFRFILPEASILYAGGRCSIGDLQPLGIRGGVNAAITGDMLTTTGSTIDRDLAMLASTEFTI